MASQRQWSRRKWQWARAPALPLLRAPQLQGPDVWRRLLLAKAEPEEGGHLADETQIG